LITISGELLIVEGMELKKYVRKFLNRLYVKDLIKYMYLDVGNFVNTENATGLDIGSGSGSWGFFVEKINKKVKKIDACDVVARPDCVVVPTIFESPNLPFKSSVYDFAMFVFVLHHCTDLAQQKKLIEEAIRCIKTTGRILIVEEWSDNHRTLELHSSPEMFRSREKWISLIKGYGFDLSSQGKLPSWYNGIFPKYNPEQFFMVFNRR